MPAFDFALVGRAGHAVVAGAAAPMLLWNCCAMTRSLIERSQINSGTSVMNPSEPPSGDYDLTLRSRQGNGKQATSRWSVAGTVQSSPTDQNTALTTSDRASVIPAKPVVAPSILRHPSRAGREAKGSAARHVSGLRPKLFNQVVGSHR
ncbi:MAG: hypothetical protein C5B58_08610 [Acidobacteria bacterium]|nr:MAG: hypothetical protein C5B58_08610 [Acidobacteriota bacterium]